MLISLKHTWLFALVVGLTACLCSMVGPSFAAPSQTGQGIMVNLEGGGDFKLVETNIYRFNRTTATTFFTNTWNGTVPTPTCTGPGCGGTPPSAPTAPAVDASKVDGPPPGPPGAIQKNRCTFFDGGTLEGLNYTQTVQQSTGTGSARANWTWTYTYNVTPTQDPVAALTAWDLHTSAGDSTVQVDITAQIAGESALSSKQHPLKYSFSLLQNDGVTSRVQDLMVTVTNDADDSVVLSATPGSTLQFRAPPTPDLNFNYETNAGAFGNTLLLQNGAALDILNGDSHPGNNNGGADGKDLALAIMDTVPVTLGPGSYSITLTGVVKGNTGTINDSAINVTQKINIIGEGCGPALP